MLAETAPKGRLLSVHARLSRDAHLRKLAPDINLKGVHQDVAAVEGVEGVHVSVIKERLRGFVIG